MSSLTVIEPEIGNFTSDVDNLKRQLWIIMTNFRDRNHEMASINYSAFKKSLKDLNQKIERLDRKVEEFEASNA